MSSEPSGTAAAASPTSTGGSEPVDQVVVAVLGVPGVHSLHGGLLGEVATYLPGRRVNGVRMREDGWDVHLVLDWDAPVAGTTEAVRSALSALVTGPVMITVEDVAAPSTFPTVETS